MVEDEDISAWAEGISVEGAGFRGVGSGVDVTPISGSSDFPRKERVVEGCVLDNVRAGGEAG